MDNLFSGNFKMLPVEKNLFGNAGNWPDSGAYQISKNA